MKKNCDNFVLLTLLIIFTLLFRYNPIIKDTVISSCKVWFYNLVPFMFSMYIMTDLLLNYGLGDIFYKLFKNNSFILVVISLLLGTPSNSKYIKEFYLNNYISLDTANWLLLFSYSPNPLFILGLYPSNIGITILLVIYITNILIALLSKRFFKIESYSKKPFKRESFSRCIDASISRAIRILVMILGIITIYAVLIRLLNIVLPYRLRGITLLLELTNTLNNLEYRIDLIYIILITLFGGLSIHTQIKSILEDTPISYKYFLIGRLIAMFIGLIIFILYSII